MPTKTAARPATDVAEASAALERASRWIRRATRPRELNAVNLATLDRLAHAGPQRISDLTASMSISQPGMTGVVARLTAGGLVERHHDPADGRVALIAVTDAGRRHLEEASARSTATLAEHIASLPVRQQRALAAAVDALHSLSEITPHDTAPGDSTL